MNITRWAKALSPRSPKHSDLEPIARPRRTERFALISLIATVLAVGVAISALLIAEAARHDAKQQRNSKTAAVQALGTANSSLTKNGLAPVATPTQAGPAPTVTQTVTQPPATGAQGPGPSAAQIQLAVASYCAAIHCGTGPSAAQVAQAVASYCDVNGKCRGPAGSSATGAPGQNGTPGAQGAAGQNATADQVAEAVATYCGSHNQCTGPTGATGATGPAGQPGPNGIDGQPPLSWTYTDALGLQHTCSRTDPFDAAQPTYTCS